MLKIFVENICSLSFWTVSSTFWQCHSPCMHRVTQQIVCAFFVLSLFECDKVSTTLFNCGSEVFKMHDLPTGCLSCTPPASLPPGFVCAIYKLECEHKYDEMKRCTAHSTLDWWLNWCNTAHRKSPTTPAECILCMPLTVSTAPKYYMASMWWWN